MPGRFLDHAVIRPGAGRCVVLVSRLRYVHGDGRVFTVPAGFESDLASVPWWLRSLAPRWQRSLRAGLFHDCGYRWYERWQLARAEVDALFYDQLREDGTNRVHAWLMQRLVRLFGGRAWRRWRDTPEAERGVAPPPVTRGESGP